MKTINLVSRDGARRRKVKCQGVEESDSGIIIVKTSGYGIKTATIYPKSKWKVEVEEPVPELTVKPKAKKPAPPPPTPPEPEPDPQPLGSSEDDLPQEEFSDEEMDLINTPDARISSSVTGDLKKELPGEYNVHVTHEKIGAQELLKMQSHVDSNYALQEGERKAKQARVKRALQQQVENLGVGCVPD